MGSAAFGGMGTHFARGAKPADMTRLIISRCHRADVAWFRAGGVC